MRRVVAAMLAASAVVPLMAMATACSSGDPSTTTTAPAVPATPSVLASSAAAIPAAVAAVEAARGGPQRYTDVNVTPQGVNLFVAVGDGTEVSYYVEAGSLGAPGAPAPATLAAFTLDGVDLAVGPAVLATVGAQFPTGTIVSLALVKRTDVGVAWTVGYRSTQGGLLTVLFGPRGGPPLGTIIAG